MQICVPEKNFPRLPRPSNEPLTARHEWIIAFAILVIFCCQSASAHSYYRGNYWNLIRLNRIAAAAARAQRVQMIATLQRQVAEARTVLNQANSNGLKSEADLNSAIAKLDAARRAVDTCRTNTREAAKTLKSIEQEIMNDPKVNGAYATAQKDASTAEATLVKTIRQILNLSTSEPGPNAGRNKIMAGLSDAQIDALKSDQRYMNAESDWRIAVNVVAKSRMQLLESDSDWQTAHDELSSAHQHEKSAEHERSVSGHSAAAQRNRTQSLHYIALTAQQVINQGEMRLRQLGSHP